jgi:hypothetical protein
VRCPRCGNENPEMNRFCGMCGATILQATPAAASGQAASGQGAVSAAGETVGRPAAPVAPQNPAPHSVPRSSAPANDDGPVISGPSFLGLNQPAPASSTFPRKRASLSIDPHSTSSSRSLDYLLDDEDEEESQGGGWKFGVMLLAIALAVGAGYFRYKNHGLDGLISDTKKPSATQPADGADSNALSSGDSAPAPAANPVAKSAASNQPAPAQPASSPAPASSTQAPSAQAASAPVVAKATPPAAVNQASPAAAPAASAPQERDSDTTANAPASAPSAAAAKSANDSDDSEDDAAPAKAEKPRAAVPPPMAKPTAALRPTRVADPVAEAQKYLYGKGASQDCDRGMHILKPAADQSNAKAMIEMGALYSAGLCTPRDLPTAYRWFAMALRKDPDNLAVQSDLQKLWGEMTQPERQLAIRLSQ